MSGELIRAQLPTATLYEDTGMLTDYAHIDFNHNTDAMTIDFQNVWHQVTDFDTNGLAYISTADQANNRIIFGASKVYGISHRTASDVAGAPATFAFDSFAVSQTTITILDITKANPGVAETAAPHGLTPGEYVMITGCTTMTQPNGKIWIVGACSDTTHFELHDAENVNFNTGGWGIYDASSGVMAQAWRTDTHTENRYTNGALASKGCPPAPYLATLGDSLILVTRNKTNNGNLTMENGCVNIQRW